MDDNLRTAINLAKWLKENKHVKSNVAYIIASNKYKVPRNAVRIGYQKTKPKQQTLI